MAFRCERISETDKHILNMKKLILINAAFIEPNTWIVDRDIDVYFFCLGRGIAEIPYSFCINMSGDLINFQADMHVTGNSKVGFAISYMIGSINIPESLKSRVNEIKKIIHDCLNMYVGIENKNSNVTISVEFKKIITHA